MAADAVFSKEKLEKMMKTHMGVDSPVKDIIKLHGDASYRTYSRVVLDDGRTYILMQMPRGKSSASEEITNFNGEHKEPPFINVARFLRERSISVADVYYFSKEDRLMILEDLGDQLMFKLVDGTDEFTTEEWYKRAIDLLIQMQAKTSSASKTDCIALQRSFDSTLYNWEFDHFLEYGIEARRNVQVAPEDRELFVLETRRMTDGISKFPTSFTHRDFQSRNILLVKNELYLIDFQDALIGPVVYDLVSLLRDSYVVLPQNLLEKLVEYYCSQKRFDVDAIKRQFNLITCQRKLKDAGRFVYIDRVKKNPDFLKYIPASLGYVKSALERLPEYSGLYEMLKKYVPEFE